MGPYRFETGKALDLETGAPFHSWKCSADGVILAGCSLATMNVKLYNRMLVTLESAVHHTTSNRDGWENQTVDHAGHD